jgi:hypothetical protein
MFPLLDESDGGFLFHCAKDPRPHQVFPNPTQSSYVKVVATWQQTLLINDLAKISGNIFGNRVATRQQPS